MFDRVLKSAPRAWFYGKVTSTVEQTPVVADETYVNVHLETAHLEYVRRLTRRYYGIIGCSWQLASSSHGISQFAAMHSPDWLGQLDNKNLDRARISRIRLLGPRPFLGDDISYQIGLFAQPEADLAAPYLKLLKQVSDVAGVGLLASASALAPLIESGIELLVGDDSARIEIGEYSTLDRVDPAGTYALVRDQSNLSGNDVAWDGAHLLVRGRPATQSHLVFTVHGTEKRADWASIPELKERWEDCRQAIIEGRHSRVDDALAVFRRTAVTSPDLLSQHGAKLGDWAKRQAVQALGAAQTSSGGVRHVSYA